MRLGSVANAGVAQLVERLFCKQMVGGSIPLAGLKLSLPLAFRLNNVLVS